MDWLYEEEAVNWTSVLDKALLSKDILDFFSLSQQLESSYSTNTKTTFMNQKIVFINLPLLKKIYDYDC